MTDTSTEALIRIECTFDGNKADCDIIRDELATLAAERDALVKALREIRDTKPIVTRNFSGPDREDELDATVTELEYDNLQEIAGDVLAKYEDE